MKIEVATNPVIFALSPLMELSMTLGNAPLTLLVTQLSRINAVTKKVTNEDISNCV